MARVTFNPNQPIQSISGTIGALTFRTRNGRTFVYERLQPELPKNPTRKQRAQFKQRTIIDQCVSLVQSQIEDLQEAINMRPTIKERLRSLYKKLEPTIKSQTKLQKAIMTEYNARFSATLSVHSRRNIGPLSVHSRENTPKSLKNPTLKTPQS